MTQGLLSYIAFLQLTLDFFAKRTAPIKFPAPIIFKSVTLELAADEAVSLNLLGASDNS
jgi:hypothetical protein